MGSNDAFFALIHAVSRKVQDVSSLKELRQKYPSPFDVPKRYEDVVWRFFTESGPGVHRTKIQKSAIGQTLRSFQMEQGIKISHDGFLRSGARAMYVHVRDSRKPGVINAGFSVSSSILGHEMRHGWQHLALPQTVQGRESPQERILYDVFCEADARAVEFGITLQLVRALGLKNSYAYALVADLGEKEKEICGHNAAMLEEICASPARLKQAMRESFDAWVAISPAQETYGTETALSLLLATPGAGGPIRRLKTLFNSSASFSRTGLAPGYLPELAATMGMLGTDGAEGNYLTETTGPAFTDPFYARICDYRLERLADHIGRKLDRKPRP